MKTIEKVLLIGAVIFTFCLTANAQGSQDNRTKDDDDIVSSIAPYPSDVRDAILNVSQYPQKLVKIERIQARSSQSFQDMLSAYPRATQEKFYDVARYPDLIHKLVADGPKSADQVTALTASLPEQTRANVTDLYPAHATELKAMDEKFQDSQDDLENIIRSLPDAAQNDMRKIVAMPDVMNLLTDRIDLTVSLGEAYKNDPEGVRQDLDKASAQIASDNAKELDAYKQKVANDPQLQNEMKSSAQDFADNYSANNNGTPPTVINNYYNTNPYPYWFGYPYWYPTAMWYPRPLYYHTGFYIGAGGNMIILGLPSYGYSNWFYHYGYRRYPRMYGWYNGYYASYRTYRPAWGGYSSVARERYYNRSRDAYRSGSYNNYGTNGRTRSTDNYGTRGVQTPTQQSRQRFDGMSRMQGQGTTQGRTFGNRWQNSESRSNGATRQSQFNPFSSQSFQSGGTQRMQGGGNFQRSSGGGMQRTFNSGGGNGMQRSFGGSGATRGSFGGGHGGSGGGGHSRARN
jgi:hypothetical protein